MSVLGCEQYEPPSHSFEVASVGAQAAALSDDGRYAVIGSVHQGGSLWRVSDGERLFNWNHDKNEQTVIRSADFSADGHRVVTTDTATLVLWNRDSGAAERFWQAPGEILSVSLDAAGNKALLGLTTELAVLFDVRRGGVLQRLDHGDRVTSVELSADGQFALTGSEDFTATFWQLDTGKALNEIQHDNEVRLVTLSPDASLALSVSKYDKALLWHTSSGEIHGEIPLSAERLKRGLTFTAAAISADNKLLLTGRADEIVELWDIETLQKLKQWRLPKRDKWKPTGAAVLDVAFSDENSSHLVAIASNGFVHQLETATPESEKPGTTLP